MALFSTRAMGKYTWWEVVDASSIPELETADTKFVVLPSKCLALLTNSHLDMAPVGGLHGDA